MRFLESADPLLIIIGPSGAGKSSAVQSLVSRGVVEVTPSWTTRPARGGEAESSVEHIFVSEAAFDEQHKQRAFLEVVQLFGLPYRYGLPRIPEPSSGRVPLIMLRAPLLPMVPAHYASAVIYQIEDDLANVTKRLQAREAEGHQLGTRLEDYTKEVEFGSRAAHRTFTNNAGIEELADALAAAIREDFA
jgi:guanylate kinase